MLAEGSGGAGRDGHRMGDVGSQRRQAVCELLAQVRHAVGDAQDPPRARLREVGELMAALARRVELFPDLHFPPPKGPETETLYLLGELLGGTHALYVWRPAPGMATAVHDHSTWAVVAGIEGEEPNTLWRRLDDASVPGRCRLAQAGQARIGPGEHIAFGPHDIHSVRIGGTQAIKHLHLYGRSLADLPDRVDFDPQRGTYRKLTEKPVILHPQEAAPARSAVFQA